jgi:uncharacterized protein YggE
MQFGEYNNTIARALIAFMVIISLFFVVKGIVAIKDYKYIGSGTTATNTVSVSGEGEAFAVPDIASVSFTVSNDAKTMDLAQKPTNDTVSKAIAYLKAQGIDEKDIKTEDYSANPKYENRPVSMIACAPGSYCPPYTSNQVAVGYTVSETISVKIRKADNAGAIVSGLGALGVTNISGPNYTVDNEDTIKSEARTKAIDNAKAKAEELAKELGVHIVRIVNFSENGSNPYPMYSKAMDMAVGAVAPEAATLPVGQNKYTSNVTITYEIR